jgi:signal peptidase I
MDQDFLIQDHKKAETNRRVDQLRRTGPIKPLWREYLETALIALVAAILLRIFVVSAYRVSSTSMENSLFEGDYIFVNQMAYDYGGDPQVGDVVVFGYPNNPDRDFIKRIVAGPGSIVEIADKVVYIDDMPTAIYPTTKSTDPRILSADLSLRDNFGPYEVPADQYFVLGDNRDNSKDSRFFGGVSRDLIKGKALFVYFSWAPTEDTPGWEFPWIHNAFQWGFHYVWNFPSQVRWNRIGHPIS